MSLIARDVKTNQIASVIMAKDWNYPLGEFKMELYSLGF